MLTCKYLPTFRRRVVVRLQFLAWSLTVQPEDGRSKFLTDVGEYLPVDNEGVNARVEGWRILWRWGFILCSSGL